MIKLNLFILVQIAIGSSGLLGQVLIFGSIFLIMYFFVIRPQKKKQKSLNHSETTLEQNDNKEIPENCPHCKSPNSKRIRFCEWCGNQIC